MSRVDEARRRAAELASRDGTESLKPLPLSDTARLTIDAFPHETFDPKTRQPQESAPRPMFADPPAEKEASSAMSVGPGDRQESQSPSGVSTVSVAAALAQKIVSDAGMSPMSREQYRLLAATLHNAQVSSGVKVIMIASAVAGEGKTLTAANLALTFTDSYHRRVLLVDGDLRRPVLHRLLKTTSNGHAEAPRSPEEQALHM